MCLRIFAPSGAPNLEWDNYLNDESRRFREEVLPLYRQMLECFTTQMWLAQQTTRTHYQSLVKSVDLWERFVTGLTEEKARLVDGTLFKKEMPLEALYNDLVAHFGRLQKRLEAGD